MNLTQMRNVVVVSEELSFTKAAKRLFLSQPSLSKSIKLLEDELGLELFERNPIKITYAGEIFIGKARYILKMVDELHVQISDISTQNMTNIIIGVPSHRCHYFMPKIISKLYKEYPNCFIKIEEHASDILKHMLEGDKIDFYIGTENPSSQIYTHEHIYNESVFIAYPESWGIQIDEDEIDFKIFNGKNFIMFPDQLQLGHYEREFFLEQGFEMSSIIECHNVETANAMVKEGLGASFLPELYVKFLPQEDGVCYKKIKNVHYKRDLSIFYKKDKYLVKPAKRFIELFKSIV